VVTQLGASGSVEPFLHHEIDVAEVDITQVDALRAAESSIPNVNRSNGDRDFLLIQEPGLKSLSCQRRHARLAGVLRRDLI
jgi:hypothetical protein